jgi:SAM-dependent methyltransferase
MVSGYGQYKDDFFNKLDVSFKRNGTLLDIGCGDGKDSLILQKEYGLSVQGVDVYKDTSIVVHNIPFKKGSIYHLPCKAGSYEYVFLHDVLHHIDEPHQRYKKHILGLTDVRRVCKKGGSIIIAEGNRYNPLFYPHMVKMRGHDHFRQSYFKQLIADAFARDNIAFDFFEAHLYPEKLLPLFRVYEYIMEHLSPNAFLAYNIAIITKQ